MYLAPQSPKMIQSVEAWRARLLAHILNTDAAFITVRILLSSLQIAKAADELPVRALVILKAGSVESFALAARSLIE